MGLSSSFTGGLPFVLISGTILTALISALLLWIYRRAVIRAMSVSSGLAADHIKSSDTENIEKRRISSALRVVGFSDQTELGNAGKLRYQQSLLSLNKTLAIYTIAGLLYAIILTSAWSMASGDGFAPTRFLWLFTCFIWPLIITAGFINHFIKTKIWVSYGILVVLVLLFVLSRNPESSFGQLAFLWLFLNAPGTIMLLLFLNRKVRAVGPLVLSFLITALIGSVVVLNIVGKSEGLMRNISVIGSKLSLEAPMVVVLLIISGFAIFGLIGWQFLRWIGRSYQKKQMSDQSITLDAIWLLFSIVQTFTLVFESKVFILTGVAAFVAYKFIVFLGFNVFIKPRNRASADRRLLLLRVFSLGSRSEKMFDVISGVCLRNGCISLIAGPDLVSANLEPHEFLSFIGGHLSRQFVSGEKDMEERFINMDTKPDPDGRFRVNEFFCRADTWQMTMQKLAVGSDAVVMDLRSFSKINQGCTFELKQLLNYIPLERILLVVDDSTNYSYLEETINSLYQQINPSSPNYNTKDGIVRFFTLKNISNKEMKNLLLRLLDLQSV